MNERLSKIKSRFCSWGWDEWNHTRRTILLLPVWYTIGYGFGMVWGASLTSRFLSNQHSFILFGAVGLVVGSAVLAAID